MHALNCLFFKLQSLNGFRESSLSRHVTGEVFPPSHQGNKKNPRGDLRDARQEVVFSRFHRFGNFVVMYKPLKGSP